MANLKIVIHQRGKEVFTSGVKAISSLNEVGQFDVLVNHAHLVTTIQDKLVLHYDQGGDREIQLQTGLLSVEDNVVDIFIGI